MVIAVVVLGVVLFVVSVRRLRSRSRGRSRWPLVASAIATSTLVVLSGFGALVALTVGRTTWNTWTAGTVHRERITLGLLVVGLPLLLVLAVLFLVVGSLRDRRRGRRGAPTAHQSG